MFYYLEGKVAHTEPGLAVIDCGGVGYACHVSLSAIREISGRQTARLYIYSSIREDAFDLYGFADLEEKRCFELLIGISGVGPKAAVSILSGASPEQLALAVLSGDEKVLTKAPGVGKKLAQRIILELKDKMAGQQFTGEMTAAAEALSGAGSKAEEAASALAVLGYSRSEAAMALRGLDAQAMSVEELIKKALKQMMK